MFAYTVACTFTDPDVAGHWLDWLRDEHLADVIAAGATSAQVVEIDGVPEGTIRYEARYLYSSREAFERYEKDHAPRLRAEGLERFPLDLGLTYERSIGEVVAADQGSDARSPW